MAAYGDVLAAAGFDVVTRRRDTRYVSVQALYVVS